LNRMLAAIGLDRTRVYIANVIPWRPPGNRTPTPQELAICLPFIKRQIELADPDILVCLGGPSAQTLLGVKGIIRARGRWHDYDLGHRRIRGIATLHPAYLLRQPLQKRLAWRDFKSIRAALAEATKSARPELGEEHGGRSRPSFSPAWPNQGARDVA
jgi:DNA polymerase